MSVIVERTAANVLPASASQGDALADDVHDVRFRHCISDGSHLHKRRQNGMSSGPPRSPSPFALAAFLCSTTTRQFLYFFPFGTPRYRTAISSPVSGGSSAIFCARTEFSGTEIIQHWPRSSSMTYSVEWNFP